MEVPQQFLLFQLAARLCALPLAVVERVLPALEITPLPAAPAAVSGIVNLGGEVVPVFALRHRFGLAERPVKLSDRLIVAQTTGTRLARRVALLVDEVKDVITVQADQLTDTQPVAEAPPWVPGLHLVKGVLQVADELAVIHDLDVFLSAAELVELAAALQPQHEQDQ
jgi:purine-binding chemotaxis protein CheW